MRDNGGVSTEPEQSPRGDSSADSGTVDVQIRRAPKLVVFLLAGAAVGVLAALILTSVFEVDPAVGFTGTFAYVALYAIPLAVALAAIIGLLFDRASRSRATTVRAEHDVTHADDDTAG